MIRLLHPKWAFYPYGLAMYSDAANNLHLSFVSGEKSKYLYSGKELYDQGGLNWYDHGSRMYNPALGRWWATDGEFALGGLFGFVGGLVKAVFSGGLEFWNANKGYFKDVWGGFGKKINSKL